ncbi:FAH family protein [Leeia sp. TBRC 13508]|uniref:FAH family protein n=1 Tax=Leeia speluncae TaxID=2884804 RepID=A0ABS8DAB6_9NEIS|nr:AraD1 family protein [Leeia speluncae]MCB6185153.1 FAH family protein [Leeia speluncae]
MRLIQFKDNEGYHRIAAALDGETSHKIVNGYESVRLLALTAHRKNIPLMELVASSLSDECVDVGDLISKDRLLIPLDHPEPSRCLVSGTGLTHLGSAKARNNMHAKLENDEQMTDSMRMFKMGLEGGRPHPDSIGVQPEWFYKGDASCLVLPGKALEQPCYADDGGEEVEIAGMYVIADDGTPLRIGFTLGNEFSDHVMEKQNYLYLAHSKLRQCAIGPELRIGMLPQDVRGTGRIIRDGKVLWSENFLTGEENMSHSIANLEHHHFKYSAHKRPGDIHVHFFGAAVLSASQGIKTHDGDVFEIECDVFGHPLRNKLSIDTSESMKNELVVVVPL